MEQAQKEPEEQEPVRPTKHKRDRDDDEDVHGGGVVDTAVSGAVALAAPDTDAPSSSASSSSDKSGVDEGLRIGAFAGGGSLSQDSGGSYGTGGVFAGTQRGSASLVGRLGVTRPRFRDSALRAAMRDELGMFIEVRGRVGLMPLHTLMDLAVAASIRLGFLSWGWENPVTVIEDSAPKEYDSDTVGYTQLMIGPSVTLARSEHLSLGMTFLGGGRIYSENTLNGFTNDVFADAWVTEITWEVAYRRAGDPLK